MHTWFHFGMILLYTSNIRADVVLNFTVRDYANKDNIDVTLRKCESFSFLGDHCDPVFQLTVYTIDSSGEKSLILKRESGPFQNTKFIKHILEVSSTQHTFPASLEFELDIHDNDMDEDQRIARFHRQLPLTGTGKIALHMGVDVKISLLVSVDCASDYYGDHCDVFCRSVSDLWTCNNLTGVRMCTKPCLHGSCVLTSTSATCLCSFGWSGELCTTPTESRLIDSLTLVDLPVALYHKTEGTEIPQHSETMTGFSTTFSTEFNEVTSTAQSNATSDVKISTERMVNVTTIPLWNATALQQTFSSNISNDIRIQEYVHKAAQHNNTEVLTAVKMNFKYSSIVIPLSSAFIVITWICIMLAFGIVCYRRHRWKAVSAYSNSSWANKTYGGTRTYLHNPHCWEYLPATHKYENTISSTKTTPTLLSISSIQSSKPMNRGTLPQLPRNDTVPSSYPPPIVTGSKIRFAATTVSTHPTDDRYSVKMTLKEDRLNSNWKISDPYEELLDQNDYCIWEREASFRTPLRTFETNDKTDLD